MKLSEIVGDTEDEVYKDVYRIMILLAACSIASPSPQKDVFEQKYTAQLNADKDNLLKWVMRSERIARVYYRIPKQYR